MPAEFVELAPLAKPDIGDSEEVVLLKERNGNDLILFAEFHPAYSLCIPADRPYGLLVEAEALAKAAGKNDLLCTVRHDDVNEPVVLTKLDRVRPGRAGVGELVGRDLDCLTEFRCKQEETVRPELADRDDRCHDLVLEVEKVDDRFTLGYAGTLGNLVDLEPVDPS